MMLCVRLALYIAKDVVGDAVCQACFVHCQGRCW